MAARLWLPQGQTSKSVKCVANCNAICKACRFRKPDVASNIMQIERFFYLKCGLIRPSAGAQLASGLRRRRLVPARNNEWPPHLR